MRQLPRGRLFAFALDDVRLESDGFIEAQRVGEATFGGGCVGPVGVDRSQL